MENANATGPTGVLFWIAGVVALVWNGLGCINFVQQMSPAGLATLPPEYQAFIETRPKWALIGFAVSVIAGLIGAVLLLMGSSKSVLAFVLSGVGAIVATFSTLSTGITFFIIGGAISIVLAAVFA
ncbi:hypothetical protein [Yoonia sp. SDW83-1]|uniref:hypothetical protein n=1 Tax=Yoonia sp. SDW83-1 TaxID=3366945 RepID=UPI00398C78D1